MTINKTTVVLPLTTDEQLHVAANASFAESCPRYLPRPWDTLMFDERKLCLFYVNKMSQDTKNEITRHIVGLEIRDNLAAGRRPVMTDERYRVISAFVWRGVFID